MVSGFPPAFLSTRLTWSYRFGNVYQDPLRPLEPGAADREVLAPLYEQVYSAIRGYDNSSIVFYEPSVHEAYLLQPTGFVNGPGGPAHNDKQVGGPAYRGSSPLLTLQLGPSTGFRIPYLLPVT